MQDSLNFSPAPSAQGKRRQDRRRDVAEDKKVENEVQNDGHHRSMQPRNSSSTTKSSKTTCGPPRCSHTARLRLRYVVGLLSGRFSITSPSKETIGRRLPCPDGAGQGVQEVWHGGRFPPCSPSALAVAGLVRRPAWRAGRDLRRLSASDLSTSDFG